MSFSRSISHGRIFYRAIALSTRALLTRALLTRALPTGGLPTGGLPTRALPIRALPTKALPTRALPTGGLLCPSLRTKGASNHRSPNSLMRPVHYGQCTCEQVTLAGRQGSYANALGPVRRLMLVVVHLCFELRIRPLGSLQSLPRRQELPKTLGSRQLPTAGPSTPQCL